MATWISSWISGWSLCGKFVIHQHFSWCCCSYSKMFDLSKICLVGLLIRLILCWKNCTRAEAHVQYLPPKSNKLTDQQDMFFSKIMKYGDGMLIFDRNYIFCGQLLDFSIWFFQLRAWIFLTAWLLVVWLNRVKYHHSMHEAVRVDINCISPCTLQSDNFGTCVNDFLTHMV